MDCLFCKIVEGKIPSYKIYEDDDCLAFLDIAPVNYGHALVVPKQHAKNYEEIDEASLAKVFLAVKRVGESLKKNMGVAGYNTTVNNDPVSGQVIPHFHVHVIPRHQNDGLNLWPGGQYGDGEAEDTLKKIKIN